MRSHIFNGGLLFTLIISYVSADNLPYTPSRAFVSPNDTNLVYLIQPASSTSTQSQLQSINISATLDAFALSISTLSSSLPFKEDFSNYTAYIPTISNSGSLEVYAGSCSSTSTVWTWQPSGNNGSWKERTSGLASSITSSGAGANFLSSAFSFSTLVGATDYQTTMYIFGGMCPTSTSTSLTTWQEEATYSNQMLKIAPGSSPYTISQSLATGSKPIAEAGFTLTGLKPAVSNSSSGIATQAQNFVLLGGHTQTAFINMSQIAIFSLPQESWSYQTINAAATGRTELAIKSTRSMTTPDSRSGHTAVLSSDGSELIIFGGWVGDISTPASPQLAILKLGSGYGGANDWSWYIPTTTGTALASGQGIYGHAAVMLPGNVMMIIGGTLISTNSARRRATTTNIYFLNTTSSSWISTYTNPSYTAEKAASSAAADASRASSDTAKRVGLGAGLGIGLAAIIAAVLVFLWYNRRLRRKKEETRQRDLQNLARIPTHTYASGGLPPMEERHDRSEWWGGAEGHRRSYSNDGSSVSTWDNLGNRRLAAGQSGNSGYAPITHIPTGPQDNSGRVAAITRKPLNRNSRAYYQVAPSSNAYSSFDFGTSSHSRDKSLGTAGAIHPIYEADEDADITDSHVLNPPDATTGVGFAMGDAAYRDINIDGTISPMSEHDVDPFRDPSPTRSGTVIRHSLQAHSASMPGSTAEDREREIASWVADWTAADALLNAQGRSQPGRLSPTKESSSGRTCSDLSENSAASASAVALSRASSTRANSLTAFFNAGVWNPFSGRAPTARETFVYGQGDVSPISEKSYLSHNPPPSSGSGTSSFTTAQTSQSYGHGGIIIGQPAVYTVQGSTTFPALRTEGQSLLPRPYTSEPGSPSKARPRRQMGWLGSIKRAFGAEDWVSSSESSSDRASPVRDFGDMTTGAVLTGDRPQPRRSASTASAVLWRRRQGREDWEDSAGGAGQRSNTLTDKSAPFDTESRAVRGEIDEEEWDIERAVRERVVQVMFTVPKERLRVVNHNVEDDKSELGSVTGSQKSVKSKKSFQLLTRKMSEADLEKMPELKNKRSVSLGTRATDFEMNMVDEAPSTLTESSRTYSPNTDRAESSRAYTPTTEPTELSGSTRAYTPMTDFESAPEQLVSKYSETLEEDGVGERIQGRRVGEVVGRSPSPDKRKSKVLEMVNKMERDKAVR